MIGVKESILTQPLMTATDVAEYLNVGERTVWRMCSKARAGANVFPLPVRISPQAVRWRREDIDKFIQKSCRK